MVVIPAKDLMNYIPKPHRGASVGKRTILFCLCLLHPKPAIAREREEKKKLMLCILVPTTSQPPPPSSKNADPATDLK